MLYLYSVQNIVVAPGLDVSGGAAVPSLAVAPDWSEKLWKPIAPFVWEPVVAAYLARSVAIFLSVPNLLVAVGLGLLVGLNAGVALARFQAARAALRPTGATGSVLASVPGLLSGFTCCVPTVVLALGSLGAFFTVAVVAIRPYFIPAAAIVLIANLIWGMRRLRCRLAESRAPAASETLRPL